MEQCAVLAGIPSMAPEVKESGYSDLTASLPTKFHIAQNVTESIQSEQIDDIRCRRTYMPPSRFTIFAAIARRKHMTSRTCQVFLCLFPL